MNQRCLRSFLVASVLLPVGAALAETQGRASFLPLEAEAVLTATGEKSERQTPQRTDFARVFLPPAEPADVDTDGDGIISFSELARHDFAKDF